MRKKVSSIYELLSNSLINEKGIWEKHWQNKTKKKWKVALFGICMIFKVVASENMTFQITQINYDEKRYERKKKKNILKAHWNSDCDTTDIILKILMTQIQQY